MLLLGIVSITALSVKLESLDGSRCYGFQCSDPIAGNPQLFPPNLPLNKELAFQVSLAAPAASATSVLLSTVGNNTGGCQFSTTRSYPAGHIHTDQMHPATRPWDARLAVADDAYELAHAYRNIDAHPASPYSDALTITIAQGATSSAGFVRCTTLHPTGAAIQITGTGIDTYTTPPIAVLSPCRYPALVGELQSGHCTEFCKVRRGSLAFRVELGRRVELQDVSVENRGSCCGRGDTLPQVLVTVAKSGPCHQPTQLPQTRLKTLPQELLSVAHNWMFWDQVRSLWTKLSGLDLKDRKWKQTPVMARSGNYMFRALIRIHLMARTTSKPECSIAIDTLADML